MSWDHCNAAIKCWEQHQRFHGETIVMTINIIKAYDKLLHLVTASAPIPTIEEAIEIEQAASDVTSLLGRQWREMTRQPFNFPKPEDPIAIPRTVVKARSSDDLLV